MNYLITANNVQLSEDMVSRSFYVCLQPLEDKGCSAREGWEAIIGEFIKTYRRQLVADCLHVLRLPTPECTWAEHTGERFPQWIPAVLARVMACGPIREAIGDVSVLRVLQQNKVIRDASNEDLDEALVFMDGLIERICIWKGYQSNGLSCILPSEPIFIRTEAAPLGGEELGDNFRVGDQRYNIVNIWREIFTRKEISSKWLVKHLKDHIDSGRLKGLTYKRTSKVRGWMLDHELIIKHLKECETGVTSAIPVID